MGSIRLLSDQTINQIAAGEVVENAASVVKELIENSVDAGATRIDVEIRGGGRQQIRISDDGVGMGREDALLAFERHATSKISTADDLEGVATHGFRGEALPSIAAISKVELTTSTGSAEGWRVSIEGGRMIDCTPFGRAQGTTVDVRSLFYNVPARAKFQRSVRSDTSEIHRMVVLAALAHPEIAMRLIVQGEGVIDLPSVTGERIERIQQRLAQLLSDEWRNGSCLVEGEGVWGVIASPHHNRSNRTGHYLFVNRRPVHSPLISRAVTDGFGTRLPHQRYPLFCLHLDLPGEDLDVNVHPQKREVRFRNEEQVTALVERSIDEALSRKERASRPAPPPSGVHAVELPVARMEVPPPLPVVSEQLVMERPIEPFATWRHYLLVDVEQLPADWCKKLFAPERGVAWVDSRAAQARIEFERLLEERVAQPHPLLIPHTVDIPREAVSIVEGAVAELSSMGIEVRYLGGTTFAIDSLPFAVEGSLSTWFTELVDLIWQQGDKRVVERERRRRLAIAICRAAGRQLDAISLGEGRALLAKLRGCSTPWESPQGRPIFAFHSAEAIDGQFSGGRSG